MAGTGGSYFSPNAKPEDLAKRTREAESEAQHDSFDTDVNARLAGLLSEFNDRDADATSATLRQVVRDLGLAVDGAIDTLFGGSVAKNTYLEGISDVDALVLLNNTELAGKPPEDAKALLARTLAGRYGREAVKAGALAVTLTLKGSIIQLLPALRAGSHLKIASTHGDRWSSINPQTFARALTAANRNLDHKLVPCIKLIKGIISTLPDARQITGYHTESIAINVFKQYSGPRTHKAMLRHFFNEASGHILSPIRDRTGQSAHVDDDLGAANSLRRRIIADSLDRIGRKIRNADGAISPTRWMELFG